MTDDELAAHIRGLEDERRAMRIADMKRGIAHAKAQRTTGIGAAIEAGAKEYAKGFGRGVKATGEGVVGLVSGVPRLVGTPVRVVTGWDGLHRFADAIDQSYANLGAEALKSEYGFDEDGNIGTFGEEMARTAGSLASLGGAGKVVGALSGALKAANYGKTAMAVSNTVPALFGNDAAVRAYDTARANGRSKIASAALASANGAIHFFGFKAFENKSLNKMLGMPQSVEQMMPKWAAESAETGAKGFSDLVRGVRKGMVKYYAKERGKGALRAGGIMGLQDFLSNPVMQMAEGADFDEIDFGKMLKAGLHGAKEGALMEGLLGGAAVLTSYGDARRFVSNKLYRGKGYKVVGADGKVHEEPGLLDTPQGRAFLLKQNPDATVRVLDIVDHGGTPTAEELDAAFLPPDMTKAELKKFEEGWIDDLKPQVEEAWRADEPRTEPAPNIDSAETSREFITAEEARAQQKALNDDAERSRINMLRKPVIEVGRAEAPKPVATPVAEAPKPVATPVAEAPKPVATPVAEAPKPVATPVATPIAEAPKPVATPVAEAPKPVATPVAEAPKPVATPIAEAPKPVAGKKRGNKLRRADGTDPLAEETKPVAEKPLSPTVVNNRAKKLRALLDAARREDGTYNPEFFRRRGKEGFTLKDLSLIIGHPEIIDALELDSARAENLRRAIGEAYETQSAAAPNSNGGGKVKVGRTTYGVSAAHALEKLEKNPDDLEALASAHQKVLAAYTKSGEVLEAIKRNDGNPEVQETVDAIMAKAAKGGKPVTAEDALGMLRQNYERQRQMWEGNLIRLNDRIGALPEAEQMKVAKLARSESSSLEGMDRKDTVSLSTGEGKTQDVADEGGRGQAAGWRPGAGYVR